MNTDKASNFINSLVRNLQVLCHSNVDFSDNVEVIGHIYLSVDKNKKFNYIVNEKVCKSDNSSTVFVSNSFHAEDQKKSEKDKSSNDNKSDNNKKHKEQEHSKAQTKKQSHSKGQQYESSKANPSFQQQKRSLQSEYVNEHKKARTVQSNNSHSTNTTIKQEAVSIDLTTIKEEGVEPDEIKSLSFDDINDTSWSLQSSNQSSVHSQRFHGTDSESVPITFGGENENYGIYPVAMYDSNLETLTSQATSSQDKLDQQLHNLPADLFQVRRRIELSLADKIQLIQESEAEPKPSQTDLAEKFGISQPTASNIIRRKQFYLDQYKKKNKKS